MMNLWFLVYFFNCESIYILSADEDEADEDFVGESEKGRAASQKASVSEEGEGEDCWFKNEHSFLEKRFFFTLAGINRQQSICDKLMLKYVKLIMFIWKPTYKFL